MKTQNQPADPLTPSTLPTHTGSVLSVVGGGGPDIWEEGK